MANDYKSVRNLILNHTPNLAAQIYDRFIDAPWLEPYMKTYENILDRINNLNSFDTLIKNIPSILNDLFVCPANFEEIGSYQNICEKYYNGNGVLGYVNFPEKTVPLINPNTHCSMYTMPLGRLCEVLVLNPQPFNGILGKSVVFIQRNDEYGRGTRYFSSPEMQLLQTNQTDLRSQMEELKLQLNNAASSEDRNVNLQLISLAMSHEEADLDDNTLEFISEHYEKIEKLGQLVQLETSYSSLLNQFLHFNQITIPISEYLPLVFHEFGKFQCLPYFKVQKIFPGLNIL